MIIYLSKGPFFLLLYWPDDGRRRGTHITMRPPQSSRIIHSNLFKWRCTIEDPRDGLQPIHWLWNSRSNRGKLQRISAAHHSRVALRNLISNGSRLVRYQSNTRHVHAVRPMKRKGRKRGSPSRLTMLFPSCMGQIARTLLEQTPQNPPF